MSTRVAFIGLGVMGLPMAGHLLAAGNKVVAHTRTKEKASKLMQAGARWADTPAAAAEQADVVFICVTDTPDVESVCLDRDSGIFNAARHGQIVVDHSTISPAGTRKIAAKLAERGVQFIDAPV